MGRSGWLGRGKGRFAAQTAIVVALLVASAALAQAEPRPDATASAVGVTVGDNFFRPKRLSIGSGTRVRWVWRGDSPHNVTVTSGPRRFASPTQSSGRFARTLRARGLYRLVCTIHGQRMRIRVN